MMKKTTAVAATMSALGAAFLGVAGCSNGWLDSKERNETPAALMFDAQKAYDAEEFAKASELYGKAVAKDPSNVQAHVGQAFSLNGEAGLSLTGLVGRAIEEGMGTGGSNGNSLALAATSSSNNDIGKIAKIVGLSNAELSSITAHPEALLDADQLREVSEKFKKLHKSWLAICPVLPQASLDTLKSEGDTVKALLQLDACRNGISRNNGAAMFAALVGVLAQSASLYQLLDSDYNGSPDVIDGVTQKFASISARQAEVAKPTATLADINTQIQGLSEDTAALIVEINKIDESEIIPLALANMQILKSLLNAIPSIPDNVKETMNKTLSKLEEAKAKFDEYKSKIGGLNSSASNTEGKAGEMKKKAEEAATKADAMLGKQVEKIVDAGATPEQVAQFNENQDKICTNFGTLATTAGLPTTTQKPCGCDLSTANACCASKGTTVGSPERATCCKGAYGPTASADTVSACTSFASSLTFLTDPEPSTPSPKASTAAVDVGEGLSDFFKLAWASWRD